VSGRQCLLCLSGKLKETQIPEKCKDGVFMGFAKWESVAEEWGRNYIMRKKKSGSVAALG